MSTCTHSVGNIFVPNEYFENKSMEFCVCIDWQDLSWKCYSSIFSTLKFLLIVHQNVASEQGLQCLHTEISYHQRNKKEKCTLETPKMKKWTCPKDLSTRCKKFSVEFKDNIGIIFHISP